MIRFAAALALAIAATGPAAAEDFTCDVPWKKERGLSEPDNVTGCLVALVRLRGWTCDSVYHSFRSAWTGNFTLSCNRGRYSYTVADKGGVMVVTLDD